MTTAMHSKNNCCIYPGEFVPLLKKEELKYELKQLHDDDVIHPPVNITEFSDSFKVEIAMPGVSREEFLVEADENILSVYAVHKKDMKYETDSFQLHVLKNECFDRQVQLPANADTSFTTCEYKAGILNLHMYKTTTPVKNGHTTIIVY
jgi:HSP20 family protein